ncbi:MAG TPA: DUF6328 family protein [Myxococcales bacterium]|nr:DUF6328 family protein [Myxococcales bacterium]
MNTETSEFAREWSEILGEIRVVLPGVQLLFGFLLTAPFNAPVLTEPGPRRSVYYACFLATAAANAFLIAPSVYHRLHWRRDVRDKEQMLRTSNQLAIAGGALLAVSMTAAVFVSSDMILPRPAAAAVTAAVGAMFLLLWFVLPLSRKAREKRAQRHLQGPHEFHAAPKPEDTEHPLHRP